MLGYYSLYACNYMLTGSEQLSWGLKTGTETDTYISASRQDRKEMSTAILLFTGFSYLVGLLGMVHD